MSVLDELNRLLSETVDAAREREFTTFEKLAGGRPLVLFGAGRLGRRTFEALRANGRTPLAFCDSNAALCGREIDGIPVLPVAEAAARYGRDAAFVITIWGGRPTDRMTDRAKQLRAAGCQTVFDFGPLFWRYPALFPHYAANAAHLVLQQADEIRACFDLWADDASRREYLAQIRWRLHFDFASLPDPAPGPIYFQHDLHALTPGEVFVDCGAYDGDTVRSFLQHSGGRFAKIYAFEPDPANFLKLRETAACDARIVAAQAAVGDSNGFVSFTAEGTESSSVGKGSATVECVSLDQRLAGDHPTFVKMDIEGSEPAALAGAREIIRRHAPLLAVSVYHAQDHLWKIPLQIRSYHPGYAFYLRPHVYDVWDLVCYAVPHQEVRPPSTTRTAPVI